MVWARCANAAKDGSCCGSGSTGAGGNAGAAGACESVVVGAGVFGAASSIASSASGSNAWVSSTALGAEEAESVCGWNTGGTTGTAGGVFVGVAGTLTGEVTADVKISCSALFSASKESSSLGVTVGTVGGTGAAGTVAEGAANSGAIIWVSPAAESPEAGAMDGAAATIASSEGPPTKSATRAYDSSRVSNCAQAAR